eukprot:c19417_g1_i1 orf=1256-2113(+)
MIFLQSLLLPSSPAHHQTAAAATQAPALPNRFMLSSHRQQSSPQFQLPYSLRQTQSCLQPMSQSWVLQQSSTDRLADTAACRTSARRTGMHPSLHPSQSSFHCQSMLPQCSPVPKNTSTAISEEATVDTAISSLLFQAQPISLASPLALSQSNGLSTPIRNHYEYLDHHSLQDQPGPQAIDSSTHASLASTILMTAQSDPRPPSQPASTSFLRGTLQSSFSPSFSPLLNSSPVAQSVHQSGIHETSPGKSYNIGFHASISKFPARFSAIHVEEETGLPSSSLPYS